MFEQDRVRTYAQVMAEGEFSARLNRRLEAEATQEAEQAERQARAAARAEKLAKKAPWLAEVTQAPRRRRSFN